MDENWIQLFEPESRRQLMEGRHTSTP